MNIEYLNEETEETPCDTCKYNGLECYDIVGLCTDYDKWEGENN